MKVISLVGARPQFIKEAVFGEKLREHGIREVLVHSGQHYDFNMSEVFFSALSIRKPDYNLGVGSGNHGEMTGKIMIAFERVVMEERPDVIVVFGDTNTTLAGALVGAKLKIPVAHVEAGIRQKPKDMPEEINRRVTDHVSSFLFCPSELAVRNLEEEGIKKGVFFTGDVMLDLFYKMKPLFRRDVLKREGLEKGRYIVCTIHRDFNTDDPEVLSTIFTNLKEISMEIPVVFPIHPRTRKRGREFGILGLLEGVRVMDPVDYLTMMALVEGSAGVITDSGGLQKEAYWCGKRAVIVMPDTGWRELVIAGWNVLSPPESIRSRLFEMLSEKVHPPKNVYGNGNSAEKMVEILKGAFD